MALTKMQVAHLLKQARTDRKLTLLGLSKKADIPLSTICRAEKGTSDPTLYVICEIAKAYGVTMNWDLFAHNLYARRKELGLTQEKVAKRAGCWPQTICLYEREDAQPLATSYIRLCEALDVDPVKFLEGEYHG